MLDNRTAIRRKIVKTFIEEPKSAYDLMATACYDMSNYALRDVVLELIYAIETGRDLISVGEELKENRWFSYFEDDEEK